MKGYPRLAAEAGVAALVSAMAGFFVSQTSFFQALTPNDGLRVSVFLCLYTLLFAGPPLVVFARNAKQKRLKNMAWACAAVFLAAYVYIASQFVGFASAEQSGFAVEFRDNYTIPVLLLPLLWLGLHVFDEWVVSIVPKKASK